MSEITEDDLIVFQTLADRASVTEPGYIIPKLAEAVNKLLAEVKRLTFHLDDAETQLEGWERIGERIAHYIPEHYEAGYNSHEDWARDAADVVNKAQAWRKNGRRKPGACQCHCQLALPAANPWDHAQLCPAYVAREEIQLHAAVEKIYPSEDFV